ncbi:hypothetical protein J6T21_04500 [Candidatus Saccharibacteria bacterium]|nr:hypothetical protein [Candidatus Saccharibacteria bacterium]
MFKHYRLSRVVGLLLATAPLFALALISDSSAVTKFNIKVDPSIELVLDTTSPSVVLDSPDGELHQTTVGATITTNNPTGYMLAVLMNGTDLTNQVNPNYSIPTLEEEIDQYHFVSNRWGFLGGDGLYHPAYSGFIINTTDAPATSAAEQIVVGVKVDAELPSGVYDCDLTVVALANRIPYTIDVIDFLQEIDEDVIDSMVTDQQYQLMDERDGKIYFVTKHEDGRVWMTQNLDFELSAEGTVLNPETSDVLATKTLAVSTNSETWGQDATLAYYRDGGALYRPDGLGTIADSSALDSDDDGQHYQLGSYYSWNAATAGSGATTEDGAAAAESICPKGWKLPTASSEMIDENSEMSSLLMAYLGEEIVYYSHTPNVRDDGTNNGSYANGLDMKGQVYTIPGASKIHIKLRYTTESCCDRVVLWPGAHSDYGPRTHNSGTYSATAYAGGNSNYIDIEYNGDSVTIGFTSDGSVVNYGYHAIITGYDASGKIVRNYEGLTSSSETIFPVAPFWSSYAGIIDSGQDWTATLRSVGYWSSVSAGNNQAYSFVSQEHEEEVDPGEGGEGGGEGQGEGEGGEPEVNTYFDAYPNAATDTTKGLNVRCVADPAAYTIH